MGGGVCSKRGAEPSCTVSKEKWGSATGSRGCGTAGLGVPAPGLMVPVPRSLSSKAAAGKDFPYLTRQFSFFFPSLFFFSFSPDNEPLKALQGTTGVPGSRAVPRQPGNQAGGPLPPPLPRPPWAGASSILPAGSGCDAGRRPTPLPHRSSPSGSVRLLSDSLPGPIPVPSAQLGVHLAARPDRARRALGGTCGARWDQRARDL